MSDKYEKMAREWADIDVPQLCNYPGVKDTMIEFHARAFCWLVAKLEAERAKETCETCVRADSCAWRLCLFDVLTKADCGHSDRHFGCIHWSRRIVENESVIAPTSAGGTTKSVAVTPDE